MKVRLPTHRRHLTFCQGTMEALRHGWIDPRKREISGEFGRSHPSPATSFFI